MSKLSPTVVFLLRANRWGRSREKGNFPAPGTCLPSVGSTESRKFLGSVLGGECHSIGPTSTYSLDRAPFPLRDALRFRPCPSTTKRQTSNIPSRGLGVVGPPLVSPLYPTPCIASSSSKTRTSAKNHPNSPNLKSLQRPLIGHPSWAAPPKVRSLSYRDLDVDSLT